MIVAKVHKTFFLKFGEMVEKIKTDVDRLLLFSKLKKVQFSQNISENLFSLLK